jgi:hypothetical protein
MKARPSHVKARQASKIREIGDALIALGYLALDEQAKALGLARSTAWTILQANHKSSGLSATVINRMLAAPQLPPLVRAIIVEYIDEKVAGLYGHSKLQLRRFTLGGRSNAAATPERKRRLNSTRREQGQAQSDTGECDLFPLRFLEPPPTRPNPKMPALARLTFCAGAA